MYKLYNVCTATVKGLITVKKKKKKKLQTMPKRCIAARCSTSNGEGYSLHSFLRYCYESIRMKEVENGPTPYPVHLKHFETIALLSKVQVTEM